jgi:DNA-binding PadR family transcriptional regulator
MHAPSRASRDLVALTVLALLMEQPRHPYEMQRLIRERGKDFVTGLPRSLYHAVERLLEAGFIEPVETSRDGRRPERTVYALTADGHEECLTRLRELLALPATEHPLFSAALSYLTCLAPADAQRQLRTRIAALEADIARLDALLEGLRRHLPRIVLIEEEFALDQRRAELTWTRRTAAELEGGSLSWSFDELARHAAAHGSGAEPLPP